MRKSTKIGLAASAVVLVSGVAAAIVDVPRDIRLGDAAIGAIIAYGLWLRQRLAERTHGTGRVQ